MVSGAYKAEILEYLTAALQNGGHVAKQCKKNFGINSNSSWHVLVKNKKGLCDAVLVVQEIWWGKKLENVVNEMQKHYCSVTVVFPKDGETFFKKADNLRDYNYVEKLGLSAYDKEQQRRIIQFRPEEIYQFGRAGELQYFQLTPRSIACYTFQKVKLDNDRLGKDRSHLRPITNLLYIWTKKEVLTDALRLESGKIVSAHQFFVQ